MEVSDHEGPPKFMVYDGKSEIEMDNWIWPVGDNSDYIWGVPESWGVLPSSLDGLWKMENPGITW